jgi:ADP-ribose pyrophosphatase YjhB (NUDIX family)
MTNSPSKLRARALIQDKNKILLMQRKRVEDGDIYYVLPGGSIEGGESEESAVMREIKEETSLSVKLIKKLTTFIDKDGTNHHVFLCEYISGEPSLSLDSPELTKESGSHSYVPLWKEINKLKDLPIWPFDAKPFLIEYFKQK